MRTVAAALLFTALASTACATTPTTPKDPAKQAALEQQYQALQVEKAAIDAERAKISGNADSLFNRAGQVEKSNKLATGRSLGATSGNKYSKLAGALGPITFDRKSAIFQLFETGPGSSTGISIQLIEIHVSK